MSFAGVIFLVVLSGLIPGGCYACWRIRRFRRDRRAQQAAYERLKSDD